VQVLGRHGPLHLLRVRPDPEAREVRLFAEAAGLSAVRTFPVGPPATTVEISLAAAAPVKGRDEGVELQVRLLRPDGSVDADSPQPVLRANVGTMEQVVRTGPGAFRARYVLPRTRYPEVAVIVAFAPWPHPDAVHGAFGTLLVPLASAIDLPGRTEPLAEMTIEIAGVTYGPTRAGPDGRFELPVVVPPGHRFGRGVATDRAGNRRVTKVDLLLPPTDQLACVMNPRRLPADGVSSARVICATTDPFGAPHRQAQVRIDVPAGKLSSQVSVGPGVFEWRYTAPAVLPDGPIRLEASWRQRQGLSRESLEVEVVQGPVAKLEVNTSEPLVHLGGTVQLQARALDAAGRPRPEVSVRAHPPLDRQGVMPLGHLGPAQAGPEPGSWRWRWHPPVDGQPGQATLWVSAFGPTGTRPARLVGWTADGTLHVAVVDQAGWPVPDEPLRLGEKALRTNAEGHAALPGLSAGAWTVGHAEWKGLTQVFVLPGDGTVWPSHARPGFAVGQVALTLAPAVPVNVRIVVEGRKVTYWAEAPSGEVLPDRPLSVSVRGATASGPRTVEGRTTVTLSGPAQLSVADVETGVTAVAAIR
jgi:hypothetical protein